MGLSLVSTVEIAPGVHMPRLGFGTYKSPSGEVAERAVAAALELGYRGVDTASLYGNEASVGKAVRESGLPRAEVFVASKLWNDEQGGAPTRVALERSLERMGLDTLDLYLVHWPLPDLMGSTWRALEDAQREGLVRAIGVCNFLQHHLQALTNLAEIKPAVNQVEHHPWLGRASLREWCAAHGVTMQAWAPVIRGRAGEIPELVEIGRRHGKSPSQVSIRWILQHGVATIPKSVHAERIAENAEVFDFELTAEEMAAIDSVDRNYRLGPDPDVFGPSGAWKDLPRP